LKPIEYEGRRVKVRPELLELEPFIRGYLTDEQKRDGPDATIIYAEFVSDRQSYILNIDNVPMLHRFKQKDCQPIEGPSHDTNRETTTQRSGPADRSGGE
jgi:hypothetical protein